MKTTLLSKQTIVKTMVLMIVSLFIQQASSAQPLSFNSYVKVNPADVDLAKGTEYRFLEVAKNVDALIKITDLVNGAQITTLDESGGLGYDAAFQPLVYTPGGTGTSYAEFSIKFVHKNTTNAVSVGDFSATSLDIDGNAKLKEFSEVTVNGGANPIMNLLSGTAQISVLPVTHGFNGINISGVEYTGIDTSALTAMYTVKRTAVSEFTLRFGAVTVLSSATSRQYSLYMKDFSYTINTLPVKLTSFTATLNNNSKVDLKWTTSSEINVSHFIIEKSTDGNKFNDAGMVFAYGTSSTNANYMLADNVSEIQTGVVYYRLRSIDNDNKSELSETRIIRIGKQMDKGISIITYPNPVSNEVRITIPAAWQNKKVVYEIFNAAGKTANKIQTANSSQTETMNVSALSPGFYIVRVSVDGQAAQQKIIKQ